MFVESRAELSRQERLFLAGLARESDEEHKDGEQAAIFADEDRGAERRKQQPGVDGAACPDSEEDSCGAEGAAEPGDPQLIGDESMIQRTPVRIFLIEQEETSGHEDDVEHALGGILALRGSFYAERCDEPIEREEYPGTVNNL